MVFVNRSPQVPVFNGGIRLVSTNNEDTLAFSPNINHLNLLDSILAVDAYNVAGKGEYGATCRSMDDASTYVFGVRHTHYVGISKVGRGSTSRTPLLDWQPAPMLRPDGVNHLAMICRNVGSSVHLEMWINGTLAIEVTDTVAPLMVGTLGLHVQSEGGQSLSVDFDNLTVGKL